MAAGEFVFAYDENMDIYAYGQVPVATITILSGLIMSRREWPLLGITVTRWYKPESSPPQLVSRIVEYD